MLNRSRIICVFVLALTLAGCNMKPFNVMNEAKMTDVLYDIHLAEATLNIMQPSISAEKRRAYYNSVFEKYGITYEDFDRSMAWYAANPKKLNDVYVVVQQRMNDFDAKVLSFEFHPEERERTKVDTLDTLHIHHFQPLYRLKQVDDSLRFVVDNSQFFNVNDLIVWQFYQQMKPDSMHYGSPSEGNARLIVTFNNKKADTIVAPIYNDSLRRRYTFTSVLPRSLKPTKVEGQFFDGERFHGTMLIDSATVVRLYNSKRYPLPDSIAARLNIPASQRRFNPNRNRDILQKLESEGPKKK